MLERLLRRTALVRGLLKRIASLEAQVKSAYEWNEKLCYAEYLRMKERNDATRTVLTPEMIRDLQELYDQPDWMTDPVPYIVRHGGGARWNDDVLTWSRCLRLAEHGYFPR